MIIEFEALTGIFTPTADTQQPGEGTGPGEFPENVDVAPSGNELFVITDSDGMAAVNYNVGQLEIGQTVTAEVFDELGTTEYDFVIDRVIFTVNGGGSFIQTSNDDDDEDEEEAPDTATRSATAHVPADCHWNCGWHGNASRLVQTCDCDCHSWRTVGNTFLSTNVGSFTRSGHHTSRTQARRYLTKSLRL